MDNHEIESVTVYTDDLGDHFGVQLANGEYGSGRSLAEAVAAAVPASDIADVLKAATETQVTRG